VSVPPASGRRVRASGALASLVVFLLAASIPGRSAAEPVRADRVVVMLEASELGGVERPFFVLEREWAFGLDLLRAKSGEVSPRRLLDGELGLRLLEARADRLEAEAARAEPQSASELRARRVALEQRIRAGLLVRAGGPAGVERLRAAHPTFDRALDALVRRRAGAAIGSESLDLVSLTVDEGEARELFRQGGHPFEAARFEDARAVFADWLLVERLGRAGQRHFDQVRRLVRVAMGSGAAIDPAPPRSAP
jgi:hypothetical protein